MPENVVGVQAGHSGARNDGFKYLQDTAPEV